MTEGRKRGFGVVVERKLEREEGRWEGKRVGLLRNGGDSDFGNGRRDDSEGGCSKGRE